MTDSHGVSSVTIDARLGRPKTKGIYDPSKSMEMGWMFNTKSDEYKMDKVNYKWWNSGWPRKKGKPSGYWKWDFTSTQELCILGGEQLCWENHKKA